MLERVHETVRVAAIFEPGKIRPVWFDWRRKKHQIQEITYHWRHKEGMSLHLHYAVTDGSALFELIYDVNQQQWTLETMDADA